MRRVAQGAAVILPALLLSGSLSQAEEQGARPRITVCWRDPERVLPFAPEAIAPELQALFAPAGVELEFRAEEPGAVTSESELLVVLLASEPSRRRSEVMGSVLRRAGGRTAWINLATIERTLALRHGFGTTSQREAELALTRALPRVIAHELVHLLAPEVPHLRGGLMDARLGRSFLLRPHVALPPIAASAVHEAATAPARRTAALLAGR